jgi:hypothetical protein
MKYLTWGSVPVPHTVLWSEEVASFLAPDPIAENRIALCNPELQGQGKPMFGKPHMQRQRRAVILGLCDLCGKPLKGRSKVSLSHASMRTGAEGLCVMQVEPLLHKECATLSLRHCPSLKRDVGRDTLHVRLVSRYQTQVALLTADATEEFCGPGVRHSGALGHAKVILLQWQDKSADWLLGSGSSEPNRGIPLYSGP